MSEFSLAAPSTSQVASTSQKRKAEVSNKIVEPKLSKLAEDINDISPENKYILKPNASEFWDDSKILKYATTLKQTSLPKLITAVNEFPSTRAFKTPIVRQTYVQYTYKEPQQLFLVSNVNGLFFNNTEQFGDGYAIKSLNLLEPKHRPVIIAPTINYWWHTPSKELMKTLINNLIDDIKCVLVSQHFLQANKQFGLTAKIALRELIEKLFSKAVVNNDVIVPATFPMRAYLEHGPPSTITTHIGAFTSKGLITSSWSRVFPASHMHGIFLLSLGGFKITRHGYSLDLYLDSFLYKKIEICKPKMGVAILQEFMNPDGTHDDEDEDDAQIENPPDTEGFDDLKL